MWLRDYETLDRAGIVVEILHGIDFLAVALISRRC
jgi:hypothetical protein